MLDTTRMKNQCEALNYRGHRFPPVIIDNAVRL